MVEILMGQESLSRLTILIMGLEATLMIDCKEVSSDDGERLGVQRKRKAAVAVEEEDKCVGV